MYRLGGRESASRYAGAFWTRREARIRRDWVAGELAGRRVPDIGALAVPTASPSLRTIAERWSASRVDVSAATATYHRSALNRAAPLLERPAESITAADIAELVAQLAEAGKARETIRKTVTVLSMVLDHAAIAPNAARDRIRVRLPREERPEISSPTRENVLAVHRLLTPGQRLPLVVLDPTGMHVGELERLTWGDVDEPRGRWRVSQVVAKTRRGRWVNVPPVVFGAVLELVRATIGHQPVACSRASAPTGSAPRSAARASPPACRCSRRTICGTGVSRSCTSSASRWTRIGEQVGQRDLAVTANTYTHVLSDEAELDYARILE